MLQEASINETRSEGRNVRYLFDVYLSTFCLKKKTLRHFRLKSVLMYAIREVPANQKCLKLNVTLEFLFWAKDANLLGQNKHSLHEGNERRALYVANKEFI
jgi:hypothetical protein